MERLDPEMRSLSEQLVACSLAEERAKLEARLTSREELLAGVYHQVVIVAIQVNGEGFWSIMSKQVFRCGSINVTDSPTHVI